MESITFKIDERTKKTVAKLAKAQTISASAVIRQAIEQFLEEVKRKGGK